MFRSYWALPPLLPEGILLGWRPMYLPTSPSLTDSSAEVQIVMREAPGSGLFGQLVHCYWEIFLNKCTVANRLLLFIHRNISQQMDAFPRTTVKGRPRGHETLPGSNNLSKHFETQICRIRMHHKPPKMFYSHYNEHEMAMAFKNHQCWGRISDLKTAGVKKVASEECPITIIYFRLCQELVMQVLITVI